MKMWAKIFFLLLLGAIINNMQALDWNYYTIRKGDNLLSIARRYDISAGEISFWNNISNPNNIQIGQRLRLLRGIAGTKDILRLNEKDILATWKSQLHFGTPLTRWQVSANYYPYGDTKNYGIWMKNLSQDMVFSVEKGKVSEIGYLRGYGYFILVDHENGWLSMYSHVEKILVQKGQKIKKGDNLARCKDDRLFFLTSYKGKPVDPQKIIGR